jgi:Na+-transporting methylmalonyl-CoA/oxaloacetate decarboxylase gamma subunit
VTAYLAGNHFGDNWAQGQSGPLGLLIILLLLVLTVLLIRNMGKHLRRLPERFPTEDTAESADPTESAEEPLAEDASEQPQPKVDQPRSS